MEKMGYQQIWNLDQIFMGGSKSNQFLDYLERLELLIRDLGKCVKSFNFLIARTDAANLVNLLGSIGVIRVNISHANSFITCLLAQNTKDQDAVTLRGKLARLESHFERELAKVKRGLANIESNIWEILIHTKELAEYKFILNEWREHTVNLLSAQEEDLIADLMADGYHAWGHFYSALVSSISVNVQVDGKEMDLSVGQAINLRSHPNEAVRKESHNALESIWKEKEELFAKILNHITGFRLQVNEKSGVKSGLEVPLKENRMKEETIIAMWSVISKYKKPFSNYLNRKAKIMDDSTMKAYNFWAPFTMSNPNLQYDEAVILITEHFSEFGTELGSFVKQAFDEAWIEAEDRANKSAVPFCASFPLTGESRVFTTFGGTFMNVLSLVHELGHAFHNYAMKSVNGLNKRYPMSLAETASTFSEMIIFDAALKEAKSKEDKLFILDEKLKRSVMNFMNIHSRFLFEQKLYEERKKGFVSPERLTHLMGDAIHNAYDGSLKQASTHSWVWTPHYYITQSPFYNFPYTFGYLFALSIFAKAKEKGKEFERNYLNLLRDSGSMSVEDLVMKHLGEDITSEEFWTKGMEICVKDAEDFLKLTSTDDIK